MSANLTVNAVTNQGSDQKVLTPLTVAIHDESRAMLAYNMLTYMKDRTQFMANGQEIAVDQLVLVDENGNIVEPVVDKEWFGTEEDNEAAKEAAFQKYKAQFIAEEGIEGWGEDIERQLQEPYTVCSYDCEDHTRVWFAPEVWDYDKANDMYNLMHYGLNSTVSMMYSRDPEQGYDPAPVAINIDDVSVANTDGDVLSDSPNPEWANEQLGEDEITLTDDDLRALGGPGDLGLAQ